MDYEADIEASALETPPWKWADKVLHLLEEKGPGCERCTGQRSHHLSEICGRRPLN